jgi:hypothetical protein
MSLSPLEYLCHILDEAEYLAARAKAHSQEEFIIESVQLHNLLLNSPTDCILSPGSI